MVRESHPNGQCTLLGELIEDTAIRYYYRRRFGDALAFVDKRSPTIHIVPCKACPDYSSSPARSPRTSPVSRASARNVRFAPNATELLRRREMTRSAMCGRLRVGKSFLQVCSIGRRSHVFGL
jgi:hypothetical protein